MKGTFLSNAVKLVGRALVVAAVGAGAGWAVNQARPDGVRAASFAAPSSCKVAETARPILRLDPRQAAAMCGDASVVIADARQPDRFALGHITGALHLPCTASGSAASDAFAALPGKRTIIVYGDSTDEALTVAESLRARAAAADVNVAVLEGGFSAWSGAGLACSSGPCQECAASALSSGAR